MPWCPRHLWEFTWEGTKVCPACGSELVAERPSEAGSAALVPPDEPFVPPDEAVVGAARLGSFDRLAAPVLLDLLAERGIRAFEAPPLANPATRAWNPMGVDVWVEASGLEEARAISEKDLPEVLQVTQQVAAEPIEEEEEDFVEDEAEDEEFITWSSFGWMEFDPARVFLEICEEEGITARSELPLDKPIPAWAESYGRMHIEVEDIHVDAAEALLETVEERLAERGVAWSEPLCDLSGP